MGPSTPRAQCILCICSITSGLWCPPSQIPHPQSPRRRFGLHLHSCFSQGCQKSGWKSQKPPPPRPCLHQHSTASQTSGCIGRAEPVATAHTALGHRGPSDSDHWPVRGSDLRWEGVLSRRLLLPSESHKIPLNQRGPPEQWMWPWELLALPGHHLRGFFLQV